MNSVQAVRNAVNKEQIQHILFTNGAMHVTDTGEAFRSECVLHGGNNPTGFVWNYINGLWYCFTDDCGGGDIFDFVADLKDLSIEHEFKSIVKAAAELLNVDISNLEMGNRSDRNLRDLHIFIEYVAKKQRVINPPYDLNKLGRVYKLNTFRNFNQDTINHFNFRYASNFNRIAVPLYDSAGNAIGASLRRTDESEDSKWLHRPKHINTRDIIYNLNNIPEETECLIIVEGVFDVANLHQLEIPNSGATFGAHLADEQVDLILHRFTDVLLMYDGDEAGIKATIKAIGLLKNKVNLMCYDLSYTEFHDPGEIETQEEFLELTLYPPHVFLENHKNFIKGEKKHD